MRCLLARQISIAANGGAYLTRVLTGSGGVSIKTLNATALVREATELHECSPVASAALGRVMMGAILLGSGRDYGEVTQLRLRGGGALGVVCAEVVTDANGQMSVRGFVEVINCLLHYCWAFFIMFYI